MNNFIEIITDFVDMNGVRHIDGYTSADEEDSGCVIGYIFMGEFYPCKPEYRSNPFILESVKDFVNPAPNGI